MREIKRLGLMEQGGRRYLFSLFECPACNAVVEKIRRDGIKAKWCSHACYARNRDLRGAYNENGIVFISGYIYEYAPKHPSATASGYVAQHRLVAEKKMGRYLRRDEVAHHVNEIKTDNRPDNIEVMTISEHIRYHKQKAKRNKHGKFAV